MIALLQRVSSASVAVAQQDIARIRHGLLILVGIEATDSADNVSKMADKILHYRVFADAENKMNLDIKQVAGDILLVSQFTLAASTTKGRRPSFAKAAAPAISEPLFNALAQAISARYKPPQLGQFGANMQVSLCNDGPVTFSLQC